jgi:uncharacterized protein YdaU (DUF1376 family)
MSLRNQPYLPLYVQDFMTDEKLAECSAKSTGVYIRLMCLMHKSEEYGKILLKQKDKQTDNQIENFACKVAKFFPYDHTTVFNALTELINEAVLAIDGDYLIQKRMVKDAEISEIRAQSGSKGGKKTTSKFAKAKVQAKRQANTEIEIEIKDVIKEVLKHPFSKDFSKEWERWKKYKKAQHSFSYKYLDTEQTALNGLATLSGNNEQTAIAIINQSIANGWKGFVELKQTTKVVSVDNYLEQRKKDAERLKAKL